MGKGVDLARADAPLHAQVIDDFKDQLLIALICKLGGKSQMVVVPVADVDATGDCVLSMKIDSGAFNFSIQKKL